jgi:hypothetical protein
MAMKKIIFSVLIFALIFPLFSFAKDEKMKNWIERIIISLKGKFKNEVFPVFKRIWEWLKINIWEKIASLFKKEIEKRKLEVRKEFKRKTEEMKKEMTKILEKIWVKILPSFKK